MIGQKKVLNQVNNLIEKGFPRFVVITGQKGQGKTLLASIIAVKLKYTLVTIVNPKIDEIREMIEMSYKQTEPIIYLIQNADKMSIGAKNSLLKVIEEPPNNAYFIMELQQIENTLETIKSRCQEIKMESYTEEELDYMIDSLQPQYNNQITQKEKMILGRLAQNYYQLKKMLDYGVWSLYDYVDKVYNNIYKVQSANSFKIAEKIDLKDTGEGYDLEMFWNVYIYKCWQEMNKKNTNIWYIICGCIFITAKYKQKLNINGINKSMLFDQWILSIRKEWLK